MTGPRPGREIRLAGRPAIERRLLAALEATPPRIPVLLGGCGCGRTAMLRRLRERLGSGAELIDLERIATTPGTLPVVRARRRRRRQTDPGRRRARAPISGGRVRSPLRFLHRRPDPRRGTHHVPARRDARAPHLRELPGVARRPRPVPAIALRQSEPVRADDPVRDPRAATVPRCPRPVRAGASPAADARRGARGDRPTRPGRAGRPEARHGRARPRPDGRTPPLRLSARRGRGGAAGPGRWTLSVPDWGRAHPCRRPAGSPASCAFIVREAMGRSRPFSTFSRPRSPSR